MSHRIQSHSSSYLCSIWALAFSCGRNICRHTENIQAWTDWSNIQTLTGKVKEIVKLTTLCCTLSHTPMQNCSRMIPKYKEPKVMPQLLNLPRHNLTKHSKDTKVPSQTSTNQRNSMSMPIQSGFFWICTLLGMWF